VESERTLIQDRPRGDPPPPGTPGRRFLSRRAVGADREQPPLEDLVLERYRLIERLGAGGFGVVWRAHDELLHREVAVKRIWIGPEGDGERATREALAAARLSHPAIVALYEACVVEDACYLISELVEGETLARLIADGQASDEEVLEVGLALTGALAHAHARGVIHRDIKPQNVLIPDRARGSGEAAKLTDFGGASLVGEDALTRTGDVLGTLAYMAPEQSEGAEVGEEADLYALALVIYEALSGVHPVRGSTPAATARRIGTDLERLARHRRDLPRALTDALDLALAPSPLQRGTIEDLRVAFEEALERGPGRTGRTRRRGPRVQALTRESPPRGRLIARRGPTTENLGQAAEFRLSHEPQARHEDLPSRHLALPRALWLLCTLLLAGWQVSAARPGVALLVLAALLPPLLLLAQRRVGVGWLGCVLAPVLGLAGLAGAFPALAGQAGRWRERAIYGALGYWWLLLAEALLGRHLWLGEPAGVPSRAVWEGSISSTASHVIGPLLSLGVLFGALLWACSSLVLPWLVRGRSAVLDVVAATVWSAGLFAVTPVLDSGLSAGAVHPSPHGAVLGAILGAMVAVAARALRGPI
jgi:serine/threonine protein kinase